MAVFAAQTHRKLLIVTGWWSTGLWPPKPPLHREWEDRGLANADHMDLMATCFVKSIVSLRVFHACRIPFGKWKLKVTLAAKVQIHMTRLGQELFLTSAASQPQKALLIQTNTAPVSVPLHLCGFSPRFLWPFYKGMNVVMKSQSPWGTRNVPSLDLGTQMYYKNVFCLWFSYNLLFRSYFFVRIY